MALDVTCGFSGVSEHEDAVLLPGDKLLFASLRGSPNVVATFSRSCNGIKAASTVLSKRGIEVRESLLVLLITGARVRTAALGTTRCRTVTLAVRRPLNALVILPFFEVIELRRGGSDEAERTPAARGLHGS